MIDNLGNLGCHLTQYPSGRFGFVGSVPLPLLYAEGTTVAQAERAALFGPAIAGVKTRAWETAEAAREAAREIGQEFVDLPESA